jgi:hypothetical protein
VRPDDGRVSANHHAQDLPDQVHHQHVRHQGAISPDDDPDHHALEQRIPAPSGQQRDNSAARVGAGGSAARRDRLARRPGPTP